MKKMIAFATVALLTCVVHAVTLSYTTWGTQTTTAQNGTQLKLSEANLSGTHSVDTIALALFTAGDWRTNGNPVATYAAILQQGPGTSYVLTALSTGTVTISENQPFGSQTNKALAVFAFDGLEMDADTMYTMLFITDKTGLTVGETVNLADLSLDSRRVLGAYNDRTGTEPTTVTVNDNGELVLAAHGVADPNFITPSVRYETRAVPEPTALALLALGVAGLALKRKVK